jgi:hypothetical protein
LLACLYCPILTAMAEEEKDSEKGHARHDELFKKIVGKPDQTSLKAHLFANVFT